MGDKEQGGMLRVIVVIGLIALIGISVIFTTVKLGSTSKSLTDNVVTGIGTKIDEAQGKVPVVVDDSDNSKFQYQFNDQNKTAKLSHYTNQYLPGNRDVIIPTKVRKNGVEYTVTSIGDVAFSYKALTSVAIPDTITSIGDRAFMNNNLTTVRLPANLKSIGIQAFQTNQISSIVWPKSLTYMSSQAFKDNQLSSLDIPNGVTIIGFDAFAYNNLTNISFPDTVTGIYSGAFTSNNILKVSVPSAVSSPANAFDENVTISTK